MARYIGLAALIFIGIAVVIELVAISVAVYLLVRGGYASMANIVITLVAAIPLVLVVLPLLIFRFGHVHM